MHIRSSDSYPTLMAIEDGQEERALDKKRPEELGDIVQEVLKQQNTNSLESCKSWKGTIQHQDRALSVEFVNLSNKPVRLGGNEWFIL